MKTFDLVIAGGGPPPEAASGTATSSFCSPLARLLGKYGARARGSLASTRCGPSPTRRRFGHRRRIEH
jgi:hypothetical protein